MSQNPHILRRQGAALVLIDMQQRLLPHIEDHEGVLANCIRLARFARIIGLPVIVCEQQKLGPTVGALMAVLPEQQPVEKLHFSCLDEPGCSMRLEDAGCSTLLLAGIETHICVLQTALHGLETRQVHVAADATGSRAALNRTLALERMGRAGVVVSSVETAIFELLEQAGSDEFRQALPLVKY